MKAVGRDTTDIENRYQRVVQKLGADTVRALPALFNEVVQALEERPRDVLGEIWSALECGNDAAGQFFTPYTVSEFMARVSYAPDVNETISQKGYVLVHEPAVGAGGMLVAFAQMLKENGHDPTRRCYAEAVDVDMRCVEMSYIQATLMGLPTVVVHGDALIPDKQHARYANAFAWPMLARVNADEKLSAGTTSELKETSANPENGPDQTADAEDDEDVSMSSGPSSNTP